MSGTRTARKPRGRKRGFALLIVMMLIILLAVLVFAFQRDVMRETSVTLNVRDDLTAAYLAQMALVRGQIILRLDTSADYDSLNEPWAKPVSWEGETWGLDHGDSEDAPPQPPGLVISDEERKFNLLTLVRGNETQRKRAADVLLRLIKICKRDDERLQLDGLARNVRALNESTVTPEQLVRNLIKYLEERASEDSDDLEISTNPDAQGDVRSMKKQSPFEMLTIGELLQVEGWTEQLLYGPVRRADTGIVSNSDEQEEEQRDWRELTPQERFERNRATIEQVDTRSRDPNHLGIAQFLTLYSTGLININTAPRELLLALDAKLTWDVVEQILTAREASRQDVLAAEENGGTLPEPDPMAPEDPAAEEDKASFRTQDLASYQAFITRVNNQQAEEGQAPQPIEGFTEEIYTAIRPWLVVRSTVFEVLASATVGKITHTVRAVYRRTVQPAAAPAPPAQPGQPGQPAPPAQPAPAQPGDGLPAEPTINLTLLFKDVAEN